jgi:hypothetical protein
MIPNASVKHYNYMNAMSSVEAEVKIIPLISWMLVKTNCANGLYLIKIKIANDFIAFGIYDQSMEIRYQYNMDKLPTYYKAKSLQ